MLTLLSTVCLSKPCSGLVYVCFGVSSSLFSQRRLHKSGLAYIREMISTWERRTSLLNFFDWSRYKKLLLVNWPESCSALYSIGGARRTRRNLGAPSILVQTYDRQVESCLLLEGKVGSGTQCERLVQTQRVTST